MGVVWVSRRRKTAFLISAGRSRKRKGMFSAVIWVRLGGCYLEPDGMSSWTRRAQGFVIVWLASVELHWSKPDPIHVGMGWAWAAH